MTASGPAELTYQWEVSTPFNPTWVSINDDDIYSGATSTTLTLRKPPVSLSGNRCRCKVAGCDPLETIISAEASLTVSKADATVALGDLAQVYSGIPQATTVSTEPRGLVVDLLYNGSPAVPINAGSYNITALIREENYQGSATGTLVISKAGATVSLSNIEYTYVPLAPRAATVTTYPNGLSGISTKYIRNGTEVPVSEVINAGEYVMEVTLDNDNYVLVDAYGQVQAKQIGVLVIAKADQKIEVTVPAPQFVAYNSSFTMEATASSGLPVQFISSLPLENLKNVFTMTSGTGTGLIRCIQEGNENYKPAEEFVVNVEAEKADQVILWSNPGNIVYGTALETKQLNATVLGGATLSYAPDFNTILDAGTHELTVFVAETANYKASSGRVSIIVDKAPATISLDVLKHTYSGSAKAAVVTTSPSGLAGVSISYKQGGTLIFSPVAAGSYEVIATLAHKNFEATPVHNIMIIEKANATVTLSNLFQNYTGAPLVPDVATDPEGLAVVLTYDGNHILPTNAGSYSVVGTIIDPNYQGVANSTLVVGKATATVIFSELTHTYDERAKKALVSTSPGNLAGLKVIYFYRIGDDRKELLAVEVKNAGIYELEAVLENPNYQLTADGSSISAILEIRKATTAISLDVNDAVYDGSSKGGVAFVNSDGGLAEPLSIYYTGKTLGGVAYASEQAPTEAGL